MPSSTIIDLWFHRVRLVALGASVLACGAEAQNPHAAATGGSVAAGGTGAVDGAGGLSGSGLMPSEERCADIPVGQIDPPCSAADLVAGEPCYLETRFILPSSLVLRLPLGVPLRIMLMPSGADADSSDAPPLELQPEVYPADGDGIPGSPFVLEATTTEVEGELEYGWTGSEPSLAYLTPIPTLNGSYENYHVGEVAVVSGNDTLATVRLIVVPLGLCR